MTIVIDGSGTITGASTLATTVASLTLTTPNIDSAQFATVSGTAPIYPCRAWVNFNGTGTVAIRASGNVSSITDLATGTYTINFATAMSDGNYSVATNAGDVGSTQFDRFVTPFSLATGSVSITVRNSGGSLADNPLVALTVFR